MKRSPDTELIQGFTIEQTYPYCHISSRDKDFELILPNQY